MRGATESRRTRPNILWLTYEDTSPQFVSCYGKTPVVTTPFIDRLARDGVVFTNAYATAPVCSASRSALITGVCNEATGLGHHRSGVPFPRDRIWGFPRYLQDAGYFTSNNVKTDYNVYDEASFVAETWHESSTEAHWRNRPAGSPFFSVFNYIDSHQSRTMTKPWRWYEQHVLGELGDEQSLDAESVSMPPIYRDTEEMRRHLSRVYNSLRLCDERMAARASELEADGLREDTIIFCFADHGEGIPRGKNNSIGFGYRAAFVLWIPPQYRDLFPWKASTVTDELVSFEDMAPTVLSLAGIEAPEHMTGRAFGGRLRRDPPKHIFAGRNRIDNTPDLCRSAMDGRYVYSRVYMPHLPVLKYQKYSDVGDIVKAIRRDYADGLLDSIQAEMVVPTRPIEYLFDVTDDPWEIRNLADEPAYRSDLVRLRTATRQHALEVGDVMFLPELTMVGRVQDSTPYERRFDVDYNPLERLLAVTDLIGVPESEKQLFEYLEDEDDAVRYWAAVGLSAAAGIGMSTSVDKGARTGRLRRHLDDKSLLVRTEIATALLYSDSAGAVPDPETRSTIVDALQSGIPLVVLQALNSLLYTTHGGSELVNEVKEVRERYVPAGPKAIETMLSEAADMYLYLHGAAPLLYEEDKQYID